MGLLDGRPCSTGPPRAVCSQLAHGQHLCLPALHGVGLQCCQLRSLWAPHTGQHLNTSSSGRMLRTAQAGLQTWGRTSGRQPSAAHPVGRRGPQRGGAFFPCGSWLSSYWPSVPLGLGFCLSFHGVEGTDSSPPRPQEEAQEAGAHGWQAQDTAAIVPMPKSRVMRINL